MDTQTTQAPIEAMVNVVRRVYWTVCGTYSKGEEFETFEAAVEAAREKIETFDYPSGSRDSRAFVALRQDARYAPQATASSGCDCELLRWEVFRDRVVQTPSGKGGLTDAQRGATAELVAAGKGGWA